MTLRQRTLLTISLTLCGLLMVLYVTTSRILEISVRDAEVRDTQRVLDSAVLSIQQATENFNARFADWSAWDDTYHFIRNGDSRYIASNLADQALSDMRVQLMAFINPEGRLVWGTGFNAATRHKTPIPAEILAHLKTGSPLLQHNDVSSSKYGLLALPQGPMFLASRPIITTKHRGPIRGTLIVGRYLNTAEIQKLNEVTRLSLILHPIRDKQLPLNFRRALKNLSQKTLSQSRQSFIEPVNGEIIGAYALLNDIFDKPAFLLCVIVPREIYQQSRVSQRNLLLAVVVAGLCFAAVTLLLVERNVLAPLARLNNDVSKVALSKDLSMRLSVTGKDELSHLGEAINGMLRGLQIAERDRARSNEELRIFKEVAENANRSKSQFLANMSHEIRTPINGVLGMLSLLGNTRLDTEQHSLLRTAQTSADVLLYIINDILDLSKIEAGKLQIEDGVFNPAAVLDDCVQMVARAAQAKGLELMVYVEPDVPREARGDSTRVRQVLANFLSNAVKFTESGEIVARIENTGEELRFSVADTGLGLAPEVSARLFQPFTQADGSTTRRFGGTGLGLAISKQLVELMGGTIGLESEPGQGSLFWFSLPLKAVPIKEDLQGELLAPVDTEAPPATAGICFEGRRILLADDNAINREVALRWLQKWGCIVVPVANGREAVEQIQQEEFDLVLMDCQMPEMDGYAATQAIRQLPGSIQKVPIIAVTAHALEGEREKCLAAGMNDYLAKPIRPMNLANMLVTWFSGPQRWPEQDSPQADAVLTNEGLTSARGTGALPDDVPLTILNLEVLDELHESVGEEMDTLLEMFQGQVSLYEHQICEAIANEDAATLKNTAHALKGLSQQFGANEVAEICRQMETLANNHQVAAAASELQNLKTTLYTARSALQQYWRAIKDV